MPHYEKIKGETRIGRVSGEEEGGYGKGRSMDGEGQIAPWDFCKAMSKPATV